MEKREGYLQFVHSDSYKHQIDIWYKAHNISREKTELFYDFLVSLHELIEQTFLGEDIIKTEEIQRNHFTWCWDKTIENFNKERIFFKDLRKEVETGANGTQDYVVKKGINKDTIATTRQ